MRIIDDFPLPIKTVSEDEKKSMEDAIRRSNRILKRLHDEAKARGFSGGRRSFLAEVCRGRLEIPEEDRQVIVKTKSLEHDFLGVYGRMLFKISRKWARRLDKSISEDDICAAAVEGFLKAFCCFTKDEIRFSSYLTWCLERHISRFVRSFQNQLSVPLKVVRLRAQIRRVMSEEGLTFDSAVERMNLPRKTEMTIFRSMREIANIGLETNIVSQRIHESRETEEIVGTISEVFSGLDGLVFREFMRSGGEMNLSDFARKTINPKTGKPYSKMAMSLAWKRVRRKIRETYEKAA